MKARDLEEVLWAIEGSGLDVISRDRVIKTLCERFDVRPVFYRDAMSSEFGRLAGVLSR